MYEKLSRGFGVFFRCMDDMFIVDDTKSWETMFWLRPVGIIRVACVVGVGLRCNARLGRNKGDPLRWYAWRWYMQKDL
uniref:Uncharacterized protein n=1 Tax=Candidatus Kentrum sp. LFY TaxID=2126342 RepID=A0A450U659_9GAMM|nr:MAG: hypothetical protein BECKLFY1418B_GA0070995_100536 [Candidatus Kentron sp. LFY]